MVVGAFPIAKLSVLLVKQISKPIANVCKERAKNSPFFRTYVCMPPAQFYNWCEVKAKMWILNLGRPVNIPVLSQEMAIELGANLLGESVIFIIGAALLTIEYNRQSNKEAAKEVKRLEEMNHITSTITELYFTIQQQQTQLREMERMIHSKVGPGSKTQPQGQPPKSSDESEKPPGKCSPPSRELQKISYVVDNDSTTPYPDRGIILRSLNYIQMDVMSSSAFSGTENKETIPGHTIKKTVPIVSSQQRNPAVLTGALYELENDFKSLF